MKSELGEMDLKERRATLALLLAKEYISIAEVDLYANTALVLQATRDREMEGTVWNWSELVERYALKRAYAEDREVVRSLAAGYLETLLNSGATEQSLEVRCIQDDERYVWVRVDAVVICAEEKKVLITTRSIDHDRMLKRIVDLFVYRDLDYFILVDTKHNTYTMFSGKKDGTPLPPESGDNYTEEVGRFNKTVVVSEDLERVTACMQISHVLAMLEKQQVYTIYGGVIGESRDYRRVRIQYQYYDKPAGLVLLTRTDITDIFMEEQSKKLRLSAALREAQQDALTGIYNQKATAQLVTGALESQYRDQAAVLFIDVDNFKMINDTLGHQQGDRLLCFLAKFLKELAGRSGIAGRVGGDEFLLFLPVASNLDKILNCAERICGLFDTMQEEALQTLPVSCSVGVAIYPRDGVSYEVLQRKADQALYTSKRYGKNQCYFYSEEVVEPFRSVGI